MFEIKWKGTAYCRCCGTDKDCDIVLEAEMNGVLGEIATGNAIKVTCIVCGCTTAISPSEDKQ